ncbi:MAG: hypothetical protein CL531_02565 [Aestuariibacter sp.]|mgnify:CR=1 FL=1|nr:hypothetical protein [Aestuariibacter sp.]MAP21753.1 hypothetical protein [Alteromonadaceae bacterium]MAX41529.1 hypothetical protein [Alteromonadaceae bacterium]|tara:strand:- start:1350 stop:1583 length:234 start_codon:yes stop_codon:yes gene_type:complete
MKTETLKHSLSFIKADVDRLVSLAAVISALSQSESDIEVKEIWAVTGSIEIGLNDIKSSLMKLEALINNQISTNVAA